MDNPTNNKAVKAVDKEDALDASIDKIIRQIRKNKNIPPIADYFDKELHLSVVSDEAFRA